MSAANPPNKAYDNATSAPSTIDVPNVEITLSKDIPLSNPPVKAPIKMLRTTFNLNKQSTIMIKTATNTALISKINSSVL
ncbi:hypothetical protein GCM10010896_00920 [Mammaliicoccus stepanovicii]|nr:hypothetical protein GCM10010896_00920 [Mammaliicoccus stepanovicii]